MEIFQVTIYEYALIYGETDEDEDEEEFTGTLYKNEILPREEVVREIRAYGAIHGSCSPLNCASHCWLDSEFDTTEGSPTRVSIFVKRNGEIISGQELQGLLDQANS